MAESLHDKDDIAFTFVSGSTAARALFAKSTPTVDRLRELWDGADRTNVRARLEEAGRIADQNKPDELALLIMVAREFGKAFPGEPLPVPVPSA